MLKPYETKLKNIKEEILKIGVDVVEALEVCLKALEEKKIDIYTSKELEKAFDKEVLLSPLPWKGMIIPLLTNKKKEVGVTPALLNGYAELVEQIAASRNVVLDSSIGNANKTTISLVKVLIYGFVGVLLLFVFIRRIRKNG